MNNKTAIGFATLTVVLNGFIGHFFAPSGLLLTPIVLTVTTSFIVFGTKKLNLNIISLLTYLFVGLNDISIKLYSGGGHDSEGLGWINMLLFIGLIPTFIILGIGAFRRQEENLKDDVIALALFVALIAIHLLLFGNLGVGRYYWYNWNG